MQNYNNIGTYLLDKSANDKTISFGAYTESCSVGMVDGNKKYNVRVMHENDMLAWSISGYKFAEKHRRAIMAFIDAFNEGGNDYKLRYSIGEKSITIAGIEANVDTSKAIAVVENALRFFSGDKLSDKINALLNSAAARRQIVSDRVDQLKSHAFEYERRGEHGKAMKCFNEICLKYYGYGHMGIIALYYGLGKETKYGMMPVSEEHKLECLKIAVDKCPNDKYAPIMAYGQAKKLGDKAEADRMVEICQQRGSLNAVAFSNLDKPDEQLLRIADCYRNGVGCDKNERYATYYDRLAKGERQDVFKEMLTSGFEPVLSLMRGNAFYKIESLKALNGVPENMKSEFLYGKPSDRFLLTDWFVPMVNGLFDKDREVVLSNAITKLRSGIDQFLDEVRSGIVEVLEVDDKRRLGVSFEDDGELRYESFNDLSGIVECELSNQLRTLIAEFKDKLLQLV